MYEGNREIVQCNYNFKHGKKIYVDNTLKGNAMDFPVWCYCNYAKTSSKQSKKRSGELYTCTAIDNAACIIRLCYVNCIEYIDPEICHYIFGQLSKTVLKVSISPRYCFSAPRQKRRWAGKTQSCN